MKLSVFGDDSDALQALYRGGLPPGSSTGWPDVDRHYTVGSHQFTMITGIPNHGKSAWVDALLVNLLNRPLDGKPWRFLICSPENWPLERHKAKIIEASLGLRFSDGPSLRMTEAEAMTEQKRLSNRFTFALLDENETFPDLLIAARQFSLDHPSSQVGIVLDPWNQLEHQRPARFSETEYVSEALSAVIRITRGTGAHVWIVAHPAKLMRDKDGKRPVPTPYDISGSAHFFNKADNCLTIFRNPFSEFGDADYGITQVHVQKIRSKNIGFPGSADLLYDVATNRYRSVLREVGAQDYRQSAGGS